MPGKPVSESPERDLELGGAMMIEMVTEVLLSWLTSSQRASRDRPWYLAHVSWKLCEVGRISLNTMRRQKGRPALFSAPTALLCGLAGLPSADLIQNSGGRSQGTLKERVRLSPAQSLILVETGAFYLFLREQHAILSILYPGELRPVGIFPAGIFFGA